MSFEMNKIAGAILAAMILAMVSGIIASNLVKPAPLAKPAYVVASAEPSEAKSQEGAKPAAPEPIEPLLASASADAGKDVAKKCQICHTFDKGGANKVGPNLYGIIGDKKGEGRGFNFSAAMKAKGGEWSVDDLNQFIANPKAFVAGTAMGFAGIPKDSERADVIAYLNSLSDHPAPLPTAAK